MRPNFLDAVQGSSRGPFQGWFWHLLASSGGSRRGGKGAQATLLVRAGENKRLITSYELLRGRQGRKVVMDNVLDSWCWCGCVWKERKAAGCVGGCRSGRARGAPQHESMINAPFHAPHTKGSDESAMPHTWHLDIALPIYAPGPPSNSIPTPTHSAAQIHTRCHELRCLFPCKQLRSSSHRDIVWQS